MWFLFYTVIALVLLGVTAASATWWRSRRQQEQLERGEIVSADKVNPVDMECCGQHEVCEKDSLLAAVSKSIEYYDDEELDVYIGTAPERYTPEEEEQFRDILYTMRAEEVAGWVRSLQLRGIALPNALKDEVYLIIGERRSGASERH